jgi:hypothetical protein
VDLTENVEIRSCYNCGELGHISDPNAHIQEKIPMAL